MSATPIRRLLATAAPGATILVRLMVSGVFLAEGIRKFLYRYARGEPDPRCGNRPRRLLFATGKSA